MELRHLRYFVVVAEELHFGRAAARLGISQPPLSQQIKALEIELAAQLLERSTRRVELTQAGRMFLAEARATLDQADRAAQVAWRAQKGEVGELGIGMFPSAPLIPVVGQSIRTFRRRFPDVQLKLDEFESRQQIKALADGREHIAITRSATAPVLPAGLLAQELLRERLVVIMRRDHPLARQRGRLAIAALRQEPFVFYGPQMGTTLPSQVMALCRDAGFEPAISQIAGANTTFVGLVAVGLGIAVVPEAMARLRHESVIVRAIAEPGAITSVWVVRRQRDGSPLVRSFVSLLTAARKPNAEDRPASRGRSRRSARAISH
jgi:DNA-binding transcriptional LysR family regulator